MNPGQASKNMIIDFSTHLISETLIEKLNEKRHRHGLAKIEYRFDPRNSDLDKRVELMNKFGVDTQLLSLPSLYLVGLTPEEATELCKIATNDIYDFCNQRPDRFIGMAYISLLRAERALDELDRCVRDLGFKAVAIATNENGVGIDSLQFEPFYRKVAQYDIPIFLHPTDWKSYPLVDHEMMTIFGWPFDTTQAVWRLKSSGMLDKYQNLKVIAHHMGAMLPYFYGRVDSIPRASWGRKIQLDYWKQIYGDTATLGGFDETYMLAYSFFGADRMVFGTDYPFGRDSGELSIEHH
ncbi:MAG: amidohydrolase family protein [Nitrososphaerales archaeon]